jgi:hypothetical protein
MPLSLDLPVTASDIEKVVLLPKGNIWLLLGHQQDRLAIKVDVIQADNVKFGNSIMKAVAPEARVKVLTEFERQQLRDYAFRYEVLRWGYVRSGKEYRPDEKRALERLMQFVNGGDLFFKMAAVAPSDLLTVMVNSLKSEDDKDVRSFAETLAAPGNLEKLGQIIAVDLFVGNRDRFSPGEVGPTVIGDITLQTRCMTNVSNVFVIDLGTAEAAIGALDFLVPGNTFYDIASSLDKIETSTKKWGGSLLVFQKDRLAFARDIAYDLELVLNPRRTNRTLKLKLGLHAPERIAAGLLQGAKAIKARLEKKYNMYSGNRNNRPSPPLGLMDRYLIVRSAF